MTGCKIKLLLLLLLCISFAMAIRLEKTDKRGKSENKDKRDKPQTEEKCCPTLKRPLERKYYSDEDYYTGKEEVTYSLADLSKYTCSADSAVDNEWKEALAFGKAKGYHRTDKAKVFNKALGDTEAATSDLDTIACVSATVLHLLKHRDCAIWQTTADVIFARNEFFELGLSGPDIVALADEKVRAHFERFHSQCECCEYTPKTMPGTVYAQPYDCDAPFVLAPGEVPESDANNVPNPAFLRFINYMKDIFEN